MSHHFDTPTAREDPRINLCHFYLFRGTPGTVAMALTVKPDAGASGPDTFREGGLYAFRFDLNDDAREEVTFKIRFGEVMHAAGDEHRHVQSFEVRRGYRRLGSKRCGRRSFGRRAHRTGRGDRIRCSGICRLGTRPVCRRRGGAWSLRSALYKEDKFASEAFQNRQNFFDGRNVTVIVLEVPSQLLGKGQVRAWATVSLYGHAPEVQVSRWGLPLSNEHFHARYGHEGGLQSHCAG
jgi:hypothetical protein